MLVQAVARVPMGSVRLPTATVEAVFGLRRRAAGLRVGTASVKGFTIPYLEGGDPTGPPVVMVHGFSDSKDSFVDVCRMFTDGHRVVLPDLPGFGEASAPRDFRYDLPALAGLMAEFFDGLGLRAVHAVGSSLGGAVLVQLALQRPDLVGSLSLVAAAGLTMPNPSPLQRRLDSGDNPFVIDSLEAYDTFMRFVLEKQPPIPAPIRRHMAEEFMARADMNAKIMDDLLLDSPDLTPHLHEVEAQTLLLWGDRDRLIDISAGHVYHQRLPRAKMVILHGIGHCPQYECPARTGDYVLRFVRSIEDDRAASRS